MQLRTHLICIGILYLCLVLTPTVLIFVLGYVKAKEWNDAALSVQCSVTNLQFPDQICDNGGDGGGEGGEKRYTDSGCCFAYVTVKCWNEIPPKDFIEGTGVCPDLKTTIEAKYQIGSTVNCWYLPDSPSDFELDQKSPLAWLIFAIIWFVGGNITMTIWTVCMIKKRNQNNYETLSQN